MNIIFVTLIGAIGLMLVGRPRHRSINPLNGTMATPQLRNKVAEIGISLLGAVIAISMSPGNAILPLALLGAASALVLTKITEKTVLDHRRKRRTIALDLSIIALLEQLHLKLANGNSLQSSILRTDGITNKDVLSLQNLVKSGLDLESATSYWIDEFDTPSKRRAADLLLARTTTSETLALLAGLIHQLRNEQRFTLIADNEMSNQLVSIPVTIAVLVPGMIFIAIPLEATLRSLLG